MRRQETQEEPRGAGIILSTGHPSFTPSKRTRAAEALVHELGTFVNDERWYDLARRGIDWLAERDRATQLRHQREIRRTHVCWTAVMVLLLTLFYVYAAGSTSTAAPQVLSYLNGLMQRLDSL